MRITNGMMITSSLANLNGALTRVSKYNNQLASNRKILTLSDSPVGVLNSMGARAQIRRLEQYQRNVDASRSWIQQAESSVTEMEELTISIRELLTDSMGTENAEDKAIFATQLRQYTESLLELCNASNGSQYMFGGYNVTQQPFVAERDDQGRIIGVKYNGLDLTGLGVRPSESIGKVESLLRTDTTTPIANNVAWGGNMNVNGTYTVDVKTVPVYKKDEEGNPIYQTDANGNPVLDENGDPVQELDRMTMEFTFTQVQDNQFEPDGTTTAYPPIIPAPDPIAPVVVDVTEAMAKYDGSADTNIALELKNEDGTSFGTISMTIPKISQEMPTAPTPDEIASVLEDTLKKQQTSYTATTPAYTALPEPDPAKGIEAVVENVTWVGPATNAGESFSVDMAGGAFAVSDSAGNLIEIDADIEAAIKKAMEEAGGYKGQALGIRVPLVGTDDKEYGSIQMTVAAVSEDPLPTAAELAKRIKNEALADTDEFKVVKAPLVISSESVKNAAATTGPKSPAGLEWTGSIRDTTQKYTLNVIPDADGNAAAIALTNTFGSVVHTVPASAIKAEPIAAKPTDGGDPPREFAGQNVRYTLDLSAEGYGKVTWTTEDMIRDYLKDADTTEKTQQFMQELDGKIAAVWPKAHDLINFVASAEYVASNIGYEATQHIQFEVGHNIMTDVTFTGLELVGTGKDNLFKIMIDLADMLDNNARNEDLTVYITKITQKQDQLLTAMVKCGNRDNKMTTMVNRYKLDAINYEANRSNIEDIDQAEVIMQMKYSEAIYKQALAASAQIIQPTLMDFLR